MRTEAVAVRPEAGRAPAWAGLLLLGLAALALRVASILFLDRTGLFELYLGDAASYDAWARALAGGDWIGREAFYQAPLYPYLLGLHYALLGADPLPPRLLQALGGSAACVLLAGAGERFFDRRAGRIAGWILALYPPAIFFDGIIQKTSLATLLGAALLYLLAESQRAPRARTLYASGLVLGLLALTRENALILAPLLPLWAAWGAGSVAAREGAAAGGPPPPRASGGMRRRAAVWLLAGLVTALAPPAIRNGMLSGEFLPTTAQFGPNFYIGNNPKADGTYRPLAAGRGDPAHERADAEALAERALGRRLSPGEVSRYWTAESLRYIAGQPFHWLALMARKTALALNAVELADTEDIYAYGEWSPLLRPARILHFGVLLPLGAFGALVAWPRRRRLAPVYILAGAYALGVIATYVFARYRFPLVLPLAILAGAGLSAGRGWLARAGRKARAAAAALVVAAAALANLPLVDPGSFAAPALCNAAYAWMEQRGDPQRAGALIERALRLAPEYPNALHLQGVLQAQRGESAAAEASLRRSIAGEPDRALTHAHLAGLLAASGRTEEAEAAYREALRLDPDDPVTLNDLSGLLAGRGRYDEAIPLLERAMALVADPRDIRLNHALLLARSGRTAESELLLREWLRERPGEVRYAAALAEIEARSGRAQAAVARLEEALRRHPERGDIASQLAWLLATHPDAGVRDGERSLEIARGLARGGAADPRALDLLAAALAATGRFAEAVRAAEAGENRALQRGDRRAAEEIALRRALYASGRPYLSGPQ